LELRSQAWRLAWWGLCLAPPGVLHDRPERDTADRGQGEGHRAGLAVAFTLLFLGEAGVGVGGKCGQDLEDVAVRPGGDLVVMQPSVQEARDF
jgi:hypothetical protein